jgi:hypothetical protein
MRIILIITLIFIVVSCKSNTQKDSPSNYVLDKHRQFSRYTDPSDLAYLYSELPKSLDNLSNLIKKQLIHPFDVGKFANKIPKGREFEDHDFPTVSLMLEELLKRDENGLLESRKPENRLVVACVHHSMLLGSILRHRGIPVRIRSGFAKYIGDRKDIRVSHIICEVWDQEHSEWILVDPDRQKVNFSRNEFEFSYETWTLLRNNNLGNIRYVSKDGNVDRVTFHLLIYDLSYIIGDEESYWEDPSIVSQINEGISDLSEYELQVLDKIAVYLKNPDNHLRELEKIITKNTFLQF